MEKVERAHELVKSHQYRQGLFQDDTLRNSYADALMEMLNSAYTYVFDRDNLQLWYGIHLIYHDFSSIIYKLRRLGWRPLDTEQKKFIEQCIGVIHQMIEDGEILITYAFGQKWIWSEEREVFIHASGG